MDKSPDRFGIQKFLFKKKLGIREQVQRIIFLCSVVSFFTVGVIALAGMFTARHNSIEDGSQMGERAAEIAVDKLESAARKRISLLARERAKVLYTQLKRLEDQAILLSVWVSDMHDRPEDYSPKPISFPRAENAGIVTPQLELAPDTGYDAVKDAVGLVGNASPYMVRLAQYTGYGTVVSLGDERGFYISADTESDKHLTPEGKPIAFDPRTRPWYKKAKEAGKVVYTDIYKDQYSGQLRLGCAAPYYRNKKFSGVAVIAFYLSALNSAEGAEDKETKVLYAADTCFIVDGKGNLVALKDDTHIFPDMKVGQSYQLEGKNAGLIDTMKAMIAQEEGVRSVSINGKDYLIAYSPIPEVGWSSAVAYDAGDITKTKETARQDVLAIAQKNVKDMDSFITRLILFMIAAIILSVWAFRKIGRRLGDRFAKPILELSDGVREMAGGNLDRKLTIETGDEIEQLANSFNNMTAELKSYIENLARVTAEKERVAAELSVAKQIQIGALPQNFLTEHKEFQIYASMDAAKAVGGDFYDFYMTDENHLVVTIADVSGKGVPAALYMMRAKTTLKNLTLMADQDDDFAAIMMRANQELCRENESMMFVTVFFAQLNLVTGELIYVNAGHNTPLVCQDGEFCYLVQKKKHMMMGADEDATYQAHRITLGRNDMLFLYTDGVTEAMDKDKNLYSEGRLLAALNRIDSDASAQEILKAVRTDIYAHADGAEQSDDITMLGVRFFGKPDSID